MSQEFANPQIKLKDPFEQFDVQSAKAVRASIFPETYGLRKARQLPLSHTARIRSKPVVIQTKPDIVVKPSAVRTSLIGAHQERFQALLSEERLQAKLTMPELPQRFMQRPNLVAYLSQSHAPVISVTAPAGYGKSSLLVEWLKSDDRQTIWLSLDKQDDQPQHFWMLLATALERVLPGAGRRTLAQLQLPQPPTIKAVLPILLKDLERSQTLAAAALKPKSYDSNAAPMVLVLDNFHTIRNRIIHDRLVDFIHGLTTQLQIVVVSRKPIPSLPKRLASNKQIVLLGKEELGLSAYEVRNLLETTIGQPIDSSVVAAMMQHTEGWITGVKFALLLHQSTPHPFTFVALNHQQGLSYLAKEVYAALPASAQMFLLCTSVLERMCPSLCDSLFPPDVYQLLFDRAWLGALPTSTDELNVKDSAEMLTWLEESGMFIRRLDSAGQWYQYHPLFAEMLRSELRKMASDLEPTLRNRSQVWYARTSCEERKKVQR